MTKHKNLRFCLLFLTLCMLFALPVWADVGDKPSICITFENMPDAPFYGTLIVGTLPKGAIYAADSNEIEWYANVPITVYDAFCGYDEADSFSYWHSPYENIFLCSESGRLVLNYPSPDRFKLLLYFPETETYAVSDVLEKYAYDASYVLDFGGAVPSDGVLLDVRTDDHLPSGIGGLFVRMVLTVLLELGIAWLFRYRTKPLVTSIITVNVVTQLLLNMPLVFISFKLGGLAAFIAYFLLEIPVLIIEAIAYAIILPDRRGGTWWKAVLYAIAANFVSFIVGFRLSVYFPLIF